MKSRTTAQRIAELVSWREHLKATKNTAVRRSWLPVCEAELEEIQKEFLPSGSGVDCGTEILIDECSEKRLVLSFSWHCMNSAGFYSGWIEHRAYIYPTFGGFRLRITGKNYQEHKAYLHNLLDHCLAAEYPSKERIS